MTEITITTLCEGQVHAVVDLLLAQESRQWAHDPRLRPVRSREQMETALAALCAGEEQLLIALDAQGCVRGYGRPAVWELPEHSILRAFLSPRNGIVRGLVLPDPADQDAHTVAAALLAALSTCWRSCGTTGDLVRWPSVDLWLGPLLVAQGFRLDSICAAHPLQSLASLESASSPPFAIRHAWPEDEEVLVGLLEEELRYHERYTSFVHNSPSVLVAFRRTLARLWAGTGLEEGAPLLLVMERAGEIVAMAENTLLVLGSDDEPGFTPSGRYGCIDNVCVREELRGQGIGHLLVQAIFDAFAATSLQLDGYLLWYNPDNPQAGRFWPRMGFVPLWTTYQRLHTPSSPEHKM